jgi:hypothetical protein
MRFSRFLAAALAPLLSVALVGGSPAYAVAPPGDPLATTVVGACSGGPGRASLAVRPTAGGGYRVEVTARDLAEGSRWTVSVVKAAADGRFKDFRRVAVGGGWTVATRFPAPADPDDGVYFFLDAQKRRDDGHRCVVFNSPAAPVAGQVECNHRRLNVALLAHQRDDGATVVRSFIFGARPDSHWQLTLTATGADRAPGGGLRRSGRHTRQLGALPGRSHRGTRPEAAAGGEQQGPGSVPHRSGPAE